MQILHSLLLSALSMVARPGARQAAPRALLSTSIAQLNRHTGKPHEHRREIARNLRRHR